MPENSYIVGLDLGQTNDYTALVVLERPRPVKGARVRPVTYSLRHIQRFKLRTPYPVMVQNVVELLRKAPLPGCLLVVDGTGVGRAVVDMLDNALRGEATCKRVALSISSGQSAHFTTSGFLSVPKQELIATLQILLQTQRLKIARSLPGADTLVRELENYRVKITSHRSETFEPERAGQHDDLVMALAMAVWVGER